MSVDLICPECGGVIGAASADAEGRAPCSCFKDSTSGKPDGEDSSDTVSIPASPREKGIAAAEASPPKLCITCGKNVSGHRRVKDSRGYQCYDCAKKEIKDERDGTIPCADCKRRIKEAGLLNYQGRRICKICYDHLKEVERVNRKVATKEYDEQNKRSVIILGIIFGILFIIVAWRTILGLMHH